MTRRTRICVVFGIGITLLGLAMGLIGAPLIVDHLAFEERVRLGQTDNVYKPLRSSVSKVSYLVSLVAFACTISLIWISRSRSSRTRSAKSLTLPTFRCLACRGELRPSNRVFGKRLKCSKCGKIVKLGLSPLVVQIRVVFALFVAAIHPILVAFLGALIAAIFGIESNGSGLQDHFVLGVNVAHICACMIGYHWLAIGTLPLMLIVVPYSLVLAIWGAVSFVRGPQSATASQTEPEAQKETPKLRPPPAIVTRMRCPKCEKSLRVPGSIRGKFGKCPGCGTRVNIPLSPPTG